MTTSFPPINFPNKPVPPFTAEPPRNPFPGFFPDMWKNITGKPYITVSSKGLANGLSEYFNDGADFGPDSLQADGSLTQTSGIQEAWNYALSTAYYAVPTTGSPTAGLMPPEVRLLDGVFTVNEKIVISGGSKQIASLKMSGNGGITTDIICNVSDDYALEIDPDTTQGTGVVFSNFSFDFLSGTTCLGFVNWNFTSEPTSEPWIIWHDFNSGSASAGTYSNFLGSDTSGVTGLFGAYITGNVASSNPIYVSAATLYFTGASTGMGINTGNSSIIYLYSPREVTLGNNASEVTIINPEGTVNIGTTSSSNVTGNILIRGLNNVNVVMNTNISGSLTIKNVLWTISTTILTANSNSVNSLKIKNVWTNQSSVPLTDGTLYTSSPNIDVKISDLFPIANFTNIPVNTPTTPSVPASGTAQQNTNSYAVDAYVYGGTVTEIQITKNGTAYTVFSNSTGLALSGQSYKLNPGDSITITYTTAPDWDWLSD